MHHYTATIVFVAQSIRPSAGDGGVEGADHSCEVHPRNNGNERKHGKIRNNILLPSLAVESKEGGQVAEGFFLRLIDNSKGIHNR